MGQHQQEIVAGNALRRIVVVLVVAALMAAMAVATAGPAFAKGSKGCEQGIYRPAGNLGACIPVGTHVVK